MWSEINSSTDWLMAVVSCSFTVEYIESCTEVTESYYCITVGRCHGMNDALLSWRL